MRAKRSRDRRLVDKFARTREERIAENKLHQPSIPSTSTANDDYEEEEDDIHVSAEMKGSVKVNYCTTSFLWLCGLVVTMDLISSLLVYWPLKSLPDL